MPWPLDLHSCHSRQRSYNGSRLAFLLVYFLLQYSTSSLIGQRNREIGHLRFLQLKLQDLEELDFERIRRRPRDCVETIQGRIALFRYKNMTYTHSLPCRLAISSKPHLTRTWNLIAASCAEEQVMTWLNQSFVYPPKTSRSTGCNSHENYLEMLSNILRNLGFKLDLVVIFSC